jgi:hypothetical protein
MTILEMLQSQGLLAQEINVSDLEFTIKRPNHYKGYEINACEHLTGSYIISIIKEGYNWIWFTEEIEPDELIKMGFENNLKTLKEVIKQAVDYCQWFTQTEWENQRLKDPA